MNLHQISARTFENKDAGRNVVDGRHRDKAPSFIRRWIANAHLIRCQLARLDNKPLPAKPETYAGIIGGGLLIVLTGILIGGAWIVAGVIS